MYAFSEREGLSQLMKGAHSMNLSDLFKLGDVTVTISGVRLALRGAPRNFSDKALLEWANQPGQKPNLLQGLSRIPSKEEMEIIKAFHHALNDLDKERETVKEALENELKILDQHIRDAKRSTYVGSPQTKVTASRMVTDLENQKQAKATGLSKQLADLATKRDSYVAEFEKRMGPLLNTPTGG